MYFNAISSLFICYHFVHHSLSNLTEKQIHTERERVRLSENFNSANNRNMWVMLETVLQGRHVHLWNYNMHPAASIYFLRFALHHSDARMTARMCHCTDEQMNTTKLVEHTKKRRGYNRISQNIGAQHVCWCENKNGSKSDGNGHYGTAFMPFLFCAFFKVFVHSMRVAQMQLAIKAMPFNVNCCDAAIKTCQRAFITFICCYYCQHDCLS